MPPLPIEDNELSSVNDLILDKLVSHQIGLQRIGKQMMDEVVSILDRSDINILEAIGERAKYDGTISFSRINAILKDVSKVNSSVYQDIEDHLRTSLGDLASYEQEYQIAAIEKIVPVDINLTAVDGSFLEDIVSKEAFQGATLSEWIDGMAQARFERIRSAVRIGATNGEAIGDILARIRGTKANNYRDGVLNTSRNSLRGITRTAVNHVANAVRGAVFSNNNDTFDAEQWVSILDEATSDYCEEHDGNVYLLDEGPRPPAHINCRSMTVPVVMSIEDMGDLSDDTEELPRHVLKLMTGKPALKTTYSKWLRKQAPDVQDNLLGQAQGALFRAGAIRVRKFIDHLGASYSLADLRQFEGLPENYKPTKKGSTKMAAAAIKSIKIKKNYGWKPDLPDRRDLLYAEAHKTDVGVPRNVSIRPTMPPIFDQSQLGSCTANALVPLVMYVHGPSTPVLSRLQLYWNERFIEDAVKADAGAELRDGIKVLSRIGVCTEEEWPYNIKKFRVKPPLPEDDKNYKIGLYSRLKTHDDFVHCLSMGFPFVGGFTVYDNFDGDLCSKKGILLTPSIQDKDVGGHAVCFIGYDMDFHSNQVFKRSGLSPDQCPSFMYEVRNSYGTDWGDKGHFWIPASYVEDRNLTDDLWTIRKVGNTSAIDDLANVEAYQRRINAFEAKHGGAGKFWFNENHDEKGRFAAGEMKAFVDSGKHVIDAVAQKLSENKRELLAGAVAFSLYHIAGADFPADVEAAIHGQVTNFAENAKVSVGMAKDYMQRAVAGLTTFHLKGKDGKLTAERDTVLEALKGLKTVLDGAKW